jgi:hypothetical protein
VGVLGGFELARPLAQGFGGGLVAGGAVGLAVGEQSFEQDAASGTKIRVAKKPRRTSVRASSLMLTVLGWASASGAAARVGSCGQV